MRVIKVVDHGMWRGHHSWTIHAEDERGQAQVSARGDTEAEAIADATTTMANRRVFTPEEKAAMRNTNQHLGRKLL